MLKNISPLLNADVLYALKSMGHGDYLILSDTNFPADSIARQTVLGELLRMENTTSAQAAEAILSLMQMPRTVIAVEMVKEAALPYIVLLTDPTTGGVTASFAMLGDIHIAEPGAQIGFAGARVIESTIRETLPEGFQRSEYLRDHGMVDMVVHRKELKETLGRVIDLLRRPGPSADIVKIGRGSGDRPSTRKGGGPSVSAIQGGAGFQ